MDCLYLCATSRLAQIRRADGPAAGARVWRTPQALTPAQWLAQLAEEAWLSGLGDLPQALDPYAERLLWEKVIAASLGEATPLFDLAGMAATAAEAHALCRVWQLQPGGDFLADEARRFLGWQAEFLRLCQAGGWLDLAGIHLRLLALLEAGHFALPKQVRWLGFDRLTPFELRLQAALAARGVQIDNAVPGAPAERLRVYTGEDARAECLAVVAWAAAQLQARPNARLGIVVPDLAGVRETLEDLLDHQFHPDLRRPDAAEVPRSFNFSLGRSLAELPLVRCALELLQLGAARQQVEQSRWSALLLASGWSASVSEADGRALFDAAMRRSLPYFTRLSGILRLAERLAARAEIACPRSLANLQTLAEVFAQTPRTARPSAWAGLFRRALKAADWPGERPLSSDEFQAHRVFGEVMDSLACLDGLLGTLPLSEALHRLRELTQQRVFQPETRGRPAIQVLGVLESAGLEFDALWVMGLNDDRWPPAPRPNPLLPAELQRAAGSAHASAEVELDFARRVQARLLAAAPEVVLSWSRAEGNRLLRPSPLLRDLPVAEALPACQAVAGAMHETACEWLADDQAPPVLAGEKVRGGSWILRAQAICPAWAFYQFRLQAEALETPIEGLDPADRGTLVHAALENFWLRWPQSETVFALSEAARQTAVAEAVEQAVAGFEHERRITLPPRFRQLEGERLQRLLLRWLALEATRPQPFTVIACEHPAEIEIEGIRVRMSVDRIDRLADGRRLILDYKTGQRIDITNWAGARLTEPQLPIYAALVEPDVAGVVFAKVLLDKPSFSGVADSADCLPGVTAVGQDKFKLFDPERFPDWAALQQHWRERLSAIAGEIRTGVAGVQFADEADLRYCDVLPILRLPERRRWLSEQLAQARRGGLTE